MKQLLDKGSISQELYLLYGMSGKLPDQKEYSELQTNDQQDFWDKRFTNNLGDQWRDNVAHVPQLLKTSCRYLAQIDWHYDGF